MTENSLTILKNFKKKLANCRCAVPAQSLIDYLEKGRFGYTYDEEEGENVVVTNDYVFADEIEKLIIHIRNIFKEPQVFLKKDYIVQNVSVASKFDNATIAETYKDEKIWKIRNGEIEPEQVHAFVYEENLAIYENRFITYLIDLLDRTLQKKILKLYDKLDTLNSKVAGREAPDYTAYETEAYLKYADSLGEGKIPVLANEDNPTVGVILSLVKSRGQLHFFMGRDLYKACKKAEKFNTETLKETNIFLFDKEYKYCYNFYLNYFGKSKISWDEKDMYRSFVTVNIMTALSKFGFKVANNSKDILLNESANLKFDDEVLFEKGDFVISLKQTADGLIADVIETCDKAKAKYDIKILSDSEAEKLQNFKTIDEYADAIREDKSLGITECYVINNIAKSRSFNACYISPDSADVVNKLLLTVKTFCYIVKGVEYLHSRFCPVCGSNLIIPESGDFMCGRCESSYHIYKKEEGDFIWIKTLPKVYRETNIGKTEQTLKEIEEAAAAEAYSTGLKRSFIAKLSQSGDKNQVMYSEIKNYLLSYKKLHSRVSWKHDTFSLGREVKFRIGVRGKTLVMFFALDPKKYTDTKYFPHDMGDIKSYEDTPLMIKIKSGRGVNNAKELINIVLGDLPLKKEFVPENYEIPFMTDEELLDKGLAKIVKINIG